MKEFIGTAKKILIKNAASLILFEVSFRILMTILIERAGEGLLEQILRLEGFSYMTADNFRSVLSHPLAAAAGAAALLIFLALLLFECCGILSCFESSWKKQKITMPGMIWAGGARAWAAVRRHPLKWILYMALSAPVLSLNLILWEISRGRFGWMIFRKLLEGLPVPQIVLLPAAVLAVSLTASFSLPALLLRGRTEGLWKRRGWRKIAGVLAVQVFVLAVTGILCVAAAALMTAAVKFGRSPGSEVSAVLIYGGWIRQAAGAAGGSLGLTAGLLFFYILFAREDKAALSRKAGRERGRFLNFLSGRKIKTALTALLLAAEGLVVLLMMRGSIPDKGIPDSGVEVTAHRGGARIAPENTMSAMEAAVESLADYAEIDVQETKDGEIVLLHDTNLARVTGLNAYIWDLSYGEVSQLDAGIKFHKKFRGERIPSLGEVLDYCRGKIRLNIELKYNGHNPDIVPKVVELIEKYDCADSCVITSMNYTFLEQVKELNPEIATGYTLTMVYGNLSKLEAADFFSVKYTYLNRAFVARAHLLGKKVCAWTLNYQGDMQRMIDCGVDNIITDDPELVRKVILGDLEENPSWLDLLKYALS